jgi:hypothetical protein
MIHDIFGEGTQYTEITRELLDSIQIGDLVAIQGWDDMLEVRAVSDNYFVMASPLPDKEGLYSICEKMPCGFSHNDMRKGLFHCGTDFWIFGYINPDDDFSDDPNGEENLYTFTNQKFNASYMASLESGKTKLSSRTSVPIYELYLKRKDGAKV